MCVVYSEELKETRVTDKGTEREIEDSEKGIEGRWTGHLQLQAVSLFFRYLSA